MTTREPRDVSDLFGEGLRPVGGDLVKGDWLPTSLWPSHRWVWTGRTWKFIRQKEAADGVPATETR